MTRALAFVGDLDAPQLDQRDRHHFERVLRLRVGDELTVSDGRGRWRVCRFDDELETLSSVVAEPPAQPPIAIGFALVKGERPEWVVQKLTELGVERIIPFAAARSVVRWDDGKAERASERLKAIAREAAMQSRRVWLPELLPVSTFEALAGADGVGMCDQAGGSPSLTTPFLLIGPEGGWAPDELSRGLPLVALGPTTLRAETAALAAATLLVALRTGSVVCATDRHTE